MSVQRIKDLTAASAAALTDQIPIEDVSNATKKLTGQQVVDLTYGGGWNALGASAGAALTDEVIGKASGTNYRTTLSQVFTLLYAQAASYPASATLPGFLTASGNQAIGGTSKSLTGNLGLGMSTAPNTRLELTGDSGAASANVAFRWTDTGANAACRNWAIGPSIGAAYGALAYFVSTAKGGNPLSAGAEKFIFGTDGQYTATAGIRATGNSSASSGTGAEMYYVSGSAYFVGANRGTGYTPVSVVGSTLTVLAGAAGAITALTASTTGAIAAPVSLAIGASGTALTQVRVYSQTITPASVAANTCAEQTFTVTGVTTADKISFNPGLAPTAGVSPVSIRVTAADTVGITFANNTAGALTPSAGTWQFLTTRS